MEAIVLIAVFIGLAVGFVFGALVCSFCYSSIDPYPEDPYQPLDSVCVDDFCDSSKPLIKYLAENHHPHVKVIVTNNYAELLEGVTNTGEINQYIKY